MRLNILGCAGGIAGGRKTTALLVDDDLLIDAGSGLGELTVAQMQKIEHVLLTHGHLDHLLFLPLLGLSLWGADAAASVAVHGQPETLKLLKTHLLNDAIWPDLTARPSKQAPVIGCQTFEIGQTLQFGEKTVTMLAASHGKKASGFYVADGKTALAFSGDTTSCPAFWQQLNEQSRLDLLIIEVSFSDSLQQLALDSGHYCPAMLAEDLQQLKHRSQILLTHQKPGYSADVQKDCQRRLADYDYRLAFDGEVVDL